MKSSENPLFSKYKVGEQSKVRCWMRVKAVSYTHLRAHET